MTAWAGGFAVGSLSFCLLVGACSTSERDYGSGTGGGGGAHSGAGATTDGGSNASGSSGEGASSAKAGDASGGTENVSGGGGSSAEGGGNGGEPLPNGFACAQDADCENGRCIDSVCCESDCAGCNACSNALTGQNDGVCAPVLVGEDPHDACDDETASNECGNDGTCDGEGACSKVAASHVCAEAGCSIDGKTFTPATTCNRDGSGACTTAAPQDCAGFPCTATGCASPCTKQTDCNSGSYCDTGTGKCAAKKPDGTAATNTYECTSGIVADGVCCNGTCTGQCQSCKQTPGTCKAVTTPRSSCGGSGTCGTKKCDGTSPNCVFPGNEVACPTTCSNDQTARLSSSCNGAGACGAAQSLACSSSQYCAGGACTSKLGNNTAGCSGAVTCSSSNCSMSPTGGGTMCCAANLQNCSQGCYNLTSDAKHCGACGADCGANRKCSSSICSCKGAKLSCNTCGSWDFESGQTEGWVNHSTEFPVTLEVRATPAGAPFTGTRSLAFDMNSPGSLGGMVIVPLCANAGIAANITSVSLYVYRAGPTYPTNKDLVYSLDADKTPNGIGAGIPAQVNTWVHVTSTFADVSANYLRISFAPFTAWSGTIYIDQIELTP